MTTKTAAKRTPRTTTRPPAKREPTAKLGARDTAVCAELDRLDDDDEIAYLGNNNPEAMKVIRSLDEQNRKHTHAMIDIQRVYLQILEDLIDPTDQSGRNFDLRAMESTRMAIAWTMACVGYRRTAPAFIKRRQVNLPGTYNGGYIWVDARSPDIVEDELRPEDRSDNKLLPPDVRSAAALRDGDEPRVLAEWHVKPEIRTDIEPRPRDW